MLYVPDFDNSPLGKKVIMIVGCSGSGKSTIVKRLMGEDESSYDLEYGGKIIGRMIPKYNLVAVGKYRPDLTTCGCDTLRGKEEFIKTLGLLWCCDADIIVEGLYIGNAKSFHRMSAIENYYHVIRFFFVYSLTVNIAKLMPRLKSRSGNNNINESPIKVLNDRSLMFDKFLYKNCPGMDFRYRSINTTSHDKAEVLEDFKRFIGLGN